MSECEDLQTFLTAMANGEEKQQLPSLIYLLRKKRHPKAFIKELFDFLSTSTDKKLRKIAMICINSMIRSLPEEKNPNIKNFYYERLKTLIFSSEEEELKYAALDAIEIMKGSVETWYELAKLIKEKLSHEDYLRFFAYMESITDESALYQPIIDDIQFAFTAAKELLLSDNWEYRMAVIKFTSLFTSTLLETYQHLLDIFEIIFNYATETRTYSVDISVNLWRYISFMFSGVSVENPYFDKFSSLALELIQDSALAPIVRGQIMGVFRGSLEEIDLDLYIKLMEISIDIGTDYSRTTGESPEFMFEYINSAKQFLPYEIISAFLREKFTKFAPGEDQATLMVWTVISKIIIETYPHQLFDYFDDFLTLCDRALAPENPAIIKTVFCELLISLPYFFGWSLLDGSALAERIVPLIADEDRDLRHAAIFACLRLVDITTVPIHKLSFKLFDIIDSVEYCQAREFLILLSAAIRKEHRIELEEAEEMAEVLIGIALDDEGVATKIWSVSCLSSLMNVSEIDVTDFIIDRVDDFFEDSGDHMSLFAIERSYDFLDIRPEACFECIKRHTDAVERAITDDSPWFTNTRQCAMAFASAFAMVLDKETVEEHLLNISVEWLASNDVAQVITATRCLKEIAPALSEEAVSIVVRSLITAIIEKETDYLVWQLTLALRVVLEKANRTAVLEVIPEAAEVCLSFIRGEVAVLKEIPPSETDVDFDIFWQMASLSVSIATITKHTPAVSEIFNFLVSAYDRNDTVVRTIVLASIRDMILEGALVTEEIAHAKDIVMALFTDETPPEKLQVVASLLAALIAVGQISRDEFEARIGVVERWWAAAAEGANIMRSTTPHLALLAWTAACRLGLRSELAELLRRTAAFLPPDDDSIDRQLMPIVLSDVPAVAAEDEEIARAAVVAHLHLLTLPENALRRRLGNDESRFVDNARVLVGLARGAAEEYASAKPSRAEKLAPLFE